MTKALYARTFSATSKHIVKPENERKTLCGGRVWLTQTWTNDDGTTGEASPETIMTLGTCDRCRASAKKRDIEL